MELPLREIEDCLEVLSGCVAAGIVGCLFLEIVERVIEERDTLQYHLEELDDNLRDALKKER